MGGRLSQAGPQCLFAICRYAQHSEARAHGFPVDWPHRNPNRLIPPVDLLDFDEAQFTVIENNNAQGECFSRRGSQIAFGASVAVVYGLLVSLHIVFGLFFALAIVTAARGTAMHMAAWRAAAGLGRTELRVAAGPERTT